MMKPTKTADELKALVASGFWPMNDAPTLNVYPHKILGWDVAVASHRHEAFYETWTVANFLRSRYDIRQA